MTARGNSSLVSSDMESLKGSQRQLKHQFMQMSKKFSQLAFNQSQMISTHEPFTVVDDGAMTMDAARQPSDERHRELQKSNSLFTEPMFEDISQSYNAVGGVPNSNAMSDQD